MNDTPTNAEIDDRYKNADSDELDMGLFSLLNRLEAAEAKLTAVGELQRQSIMCYSMNPNALQITTQDDGDFILYADVEAALKDKDNK